MLTINHLQPVFPFVCAIALLLVNSAIAGQLGQSHAFAISHVCNGSIACSLINSNWPTGKEFTCGNETISSTSFASAYPYMMMGQGISMINSSSSWPSSVNSECQDITAAEQFQYHNGVWNAYYAIVTNCGCTGTGESAIPDCTDATSQSSAACNIAMFAFCAIEMNDVVCTYT
ncbi:uncharacterized protein MELLADRAFT_72810 [Melampsora larici-populina 98AG31]|uniref:Secreted protein n=1 Tax=Melampsora larici-populina (strain 98AG31 / pathotype 3-4-7) TaxID=747676 RepID=F4RZ58_MELLP|nr:uncharacterized protein MELLADRAFT_72810 [Melampsora larici-populina 98AG31]EGG02353.1 secreted protein [Melampsora larici-populina 98AG31]